MRDYTNRLQVLEKHFCIKDIPTFDQFKTKWAEADALSRAILAASAECGDYETMGKPWRNYVLVVRSYLLQMGLIDEHAKSLRQLAAEMEGDACEIDF